MIPAAKIYVVGVPIGNLEDITLRAQRTLQEVDLIAAEDTRVARKLMHLLGLSVKKIISYRDFGEVQQAQQLVERLNREHLQLALISDAGTPCIADPGYRLIALAKEQGIAVSPIPGPSSVIALASSAGLPTDRFLFVGFLPTRPSHLRTECSSWAGLRASVIAFESAKRLGKTLSLLAELYPDSAIAIGRELTKVFEEIATFPTVNAALEWWQAHPFPKGEVALMIHPEVAERSREECEKQLVQEAEKMIAGGASHKDLLAHFGTTSGLSRKELYQLMLDLRREEIND